MRIDLIAKPDSFEGKCQTHVGLVDVIGSLRPSSMPGNEVIFTVDFGDGHVIQCTGQYSISKETITGKFIDFGEDQDPSGEPVPDESKSSSPRDRGIMFTSVSRRTFYFSRTPATIHRFRYRPDAFRRNPARARWAFATSAILHGVQRRLWSWKYFKSRLSEIRRFMELSRRKMVDEGLYTPRQALTEEESQELKIIYQDMSPDDARFSSALVNYDLQRCTWHL